MKTMPWGALAALALPLAMAGGASAEVMERFDTGFRLAQKVEVPVPPARAYAALGEVGNWWDDQHTYSGKAANMTLTLAPGGCFCEALAGGGVRHGGVLLAIPGSMLRLDAALGPLQGEGVSAVLTFEIKAKDAGSEIVMTYNVGGYTPAGVKQWADGVDQVLGVQVDRLARYLETAKR